MSNQPSENIKPGKGARFQSIDGMRGIAALGVVLYHLSGNLKPELNTLLPEFINILFSYGFLGVPVFFVISGFVISLGVGSATITPGYFGNFILRRSMRLDITYWASIALAVTLIVFKNVAMNTHEQLPSFTDVIFHMFYLQDILSVNPVISVVYWTLCMEVQLYLFFIISLWFSQKLFLIRHDYRTPLHIFIIMSLGIYSILLDLEVTSIRAPGLFISSWHYFLMGVLVSNVVRNVKYSSHIFIIWIIIEIIFQYEIHIKAYTVAGILSSFLIFSLWKMNRLNSFLTGKVFIYLGTISYTLYLVHPDIGWKVISFGKTLLAGHNTPALSGLLLLLGIAASVLAAHLFHVIFERPSLRVCNKLKTSSPAAVFSEILNLAKTSKIVRWAARR